jgi:hypothetical protein
MEEADFVCAVLPAGYSLDNVIIGIGLALGRQCPVLVFAEPEVKVPFELRSLNYVTARLSERESVGKALQSLLPTLAKASHHGRRLLIYSKLKTLAASDVEKVFSRLRNGHRLSEMDFQQLVAEIFRKAGVRLASSSTPDQGIDLSVWIDELEPIFGNPILVEVKAGRLSQSQIDDAYHYRSYHLIRSNLLLGIVVYSDVEGKEFTIPMPGLPLVVCFSIEELVDHLRSGTLSKALVNIRNRAAQGMVST